MGFDFGNRRIGVAVGQTVTGTATAVTTVNVRGINNLPWPAFDALVEQWKPDRFVVGMPISEDGSDQPMARKARQFIGRISNRYRLPTHQTDERYTSREAQSIFRESRRRGETRAKDASREDAVAARLIVEQWIIEQSSS